MKIDSNSMLPISLRVIVLIFCFSILQSCSSQLATTLTGSWKDPEATSYKDFMVVVLSKKLPVRSTVEDDITIRLKRAGVKGAKSLDVIPHTEKVETQEDRKAAVEKIQSLGHDAIITITLVKQTEESRYIPGTNSYSPTNVGVGSGYYNPVTGEGQQGTGSYAFGSYYMGASTAYNTPGYYEKDKTYFLQSNVYDLKTSKLIWSAQSQTFDPGNIAAASHDFSLVMVDAMKKANLLYKKGK